MTVAEHAAFLGFILAVSEQLHCKLHEVWSLEVDGRVQRTKWTLLPTDPRRTLMN